MTDNRYRRQFLLTRQTSFQCTWEKVVINDFNLYYHPELELTASKSGEQELTMLGVIYDWEEPTLNNQQILDKLVDTPSFDSFVSGLSRYAGQYIIIFRDKTGLFIIGDACAQFEIYYDTSCSCFGSQPKIITEVIAAEPHTNQEAVDFYASPKFLSRRLFVGNTTHLGNIKHLQANHYIDVAHQKAVRYFPVEPVARLSVKEVAPKACQMLKGYIRAIAARKKIAMAVTGGYDSRVLFLASLDVECKYHVLQHKNMGAKHYDITVPQRLTKMYGRPFEVIPDKDGYENIPDSVDFPKDIPQSGKYFENHVYLNAGISEIARNNYGYHERLSPADLAFFSGYSGSQFAAGVYRQWLENEVVFRNNGYDILDMLYWEERMGIAGAKAKTMMSALGVEVFSPFCSRDLLVLLLSTPRKDRDYYICKLHNSILLELSPDALKIPINPCFKLDVIRLMTRLKVYNLYRNLGLKYRLLKF